MKELERLFKGLGNRRRLAILQHIKKNQEANVGSIAKSIGLSFKATSRHLAILTAIDVLEKEQRSTLVYYKISNSVGRFVKHIISTL